jgi:galactokinase
MEYNRAKHFYDENERVTIMKRALNNHDKALFLKLINESRRSSTELLKNMMVGDQYEGSPLQACDRAMKIMDNNGACRINGGGFAGSIICVVPDEYLEKFIKEMGAFYGENNVKEVHVSKYGPTVEKI